MNLSKNFGKARQKYGILLVLVLLFIIASVLNSNFLSVRNLSNISKQVSITTILAFGETILIISGMLDLSNGAVLALAGLLSVSVFKMTGSLLLAFLVAIIVAVICNILNGIMVTKFKTPPFIATLAMMAMARGAALLYTNGQNIYQIDEYTVFGQGSIFGVPTPIIFLIVIAIFTWYLLQHTKLGRSLYAIGGNEEAAVASGVNINKNKMKAYIINGVFVGIAGVIFMSRVNAGLPNGGQGFEFEALTSSIIGGTSFSGGVGTAGGTVIGAFIVGTLNNIMNLSAVNSYLQQIIRGAIIALAVIYDTYSKNMKVEAEKGEVEVDDNEDKKENK